MFDVLLIKLLLLNWISSLTFFFGFNTISSFLNSTWSLYHWLNFASFSSKGQLFFEVVFGSSKFRYRRLMFNSSHIQKLSIIVNFGLKINKIPIISKMPGDIMNTTSSNLNSNVMPRHSRIILLKICHVELSRFIYILYSHIAEICSFPKSFIWRILQQMFSCIPSTITNIKSSKESNPLVNHDDLLVMTPQKRNHYVIGMPHYFYVLRPQRLKVLLYKLWIIIHCYLRLLIHNNIDLHVSFCKFL